MNCETCGAPYVTHIYHRGEVILLCDYEGCKTEAIRALDRVLDMVDYINTEEPSGNFF